MEKEFKKAFINYAKYKCATKEFKELKIKNGNINQYVARFRQLAMQGGHNVDRPQILQMFAQGLPNLLADKYFDCDLNNFEEWVDTAQKCQCIYLRKQATKGNLTVNNP